MSLNGSTSSWFISLSDADTQDWSTFTLKFPKPFYGLTAQYKVEACARNSQSHTDESISIYACRVEGLLFKGWSENDAELRNRDCQFFRSRTPFQIEKFSQ